MKREYKKIISRKKWIRAFKFRCRKIIGFSSLHLKTNTYAHARRSHRSHIAFLYERDSSTEIIAWALIIYAFKRWSWFSFPFLCRCRCHRSVIVVIDALFLFPARILLLLLLLFFLSFVLFSLMHLFISVIRLFWSFVFVGILFLLSLVLLLDWLPLCTKVREMVRVGGIYAYRNKQTNKKGCGWCVWWKTMR